MHGSFKTEKITRSGKEPEPRTATTKRRRVKPNYSSARKLKESQYVWSE